MYSKNLKNKVIRGYVPISPGAPPRTVPVGFFVPCSRLPGCVGCTSSPTCSVCRCAGDGPVSQTGWGPLHVQSWTHALPKRMFRRPNSSVHGSVHWHAACIYAHTCHHTLFIQPECFVQRFTGEGGCMVTKTFELLWRRGLVCTNGSWLIYLATQDSTKVNNLLTKVVFDLSMMPSCDKYNIHNYNTSSTQNAWMCLTQMALLVHVDVAFALVLTQAAFPWVRITPCMHWGELIECFSWHE